MVQCGCVTALNRAEGAVIGAVPGVAEVSNELRLIRHANSVLEGAKENGVRGAFSAGWDAYKEELKTLPIIRWWANADEASKADVSGDACIEAAARVELGLDVAEDVGLVMGVAEMRANAGPRKPRTKRDGKEGRSRSVRQVFEEFINDAIYGNSWSYPDRASARAALPGEAGRAANSFFKGATGKSTNFRITETATGYRMQYFSPANNAGYGKLYVQDITPSGVVVREYKQTYGPSGLIETKWVHGEPAQN